MPTNDNLLKIISHETKDVINEMDVVTPTIYKSIFSKFAALHNINMNEEEKITDSLLDDKIALYTDMYHQTSKNTQQLSDNTDKAIFAIKEKNETSLKEVLEETKNLQLEIEKLKQSVYKDELTDVFNRKWLHNNYLEDKEKSFKIPGVLAIIDLNYFKIINDTYGHIIGDKVLVYIANQLKAIEEAVIRYGGDEFIVIFPVTTTKDSAYKKLDAAREKIIKKHLVVKESSFKVSFSFGVCEFKKSDTLSDVIEKADSNMYDDKIRIKAKITGIH
ncbi:MAG: Diguanylate cyclase [Campylobacterota bacterium]|nr:Diguanylate cyclase [Campylobacterota bacterium]